MADSQHLLFAEEDGATALRVDLVRALNYSKAERIRTSHGMELCCAGVSAVWNGKRGYVAVLVRHLDRPRVRRFVYRSKIRSEGLLMRVLEDAVDFVKSLGFTLDKVDFAKLPEKQKKDRVRSWNQLRKTERWPKYLGLQPNPDALSEEEVKTPPPPLEDRTVLGRVGVVRRVDGLGMSPTGRVLSFF